MEGGVAPVVTEGSLAEGYRALDASLFADIDGVPKPITLQVQVVELAAIIAISNELKMAPQGAEYSGKLFRAVDDRHRTSAAYEQLRLDLILLVDISGP